MIISTVALGGVCGLIFFIWGQLLRSWHQDNIRSRYGDNPTPEQLDEYWNEVALASLHHNNLP